MFPGNPEICDGNDNNCDGEVDEAGVCSPAVPITSPLGFQVLAALLAAVGLIFGRPRSTTARLTLG